MGVGVELPALLLALLAVTIPPNHPVALEGDGVRASVPPFHVVGGDVAAMVHAVEGPLQEPPFAGPARVPRRLFFVFLHAPDPALVLLLRSLLVPGREHGEVESGEDGQNGVGVELGLYQVDVPSPIDSPFVPQGPGLFQLRQEPVQGLEKEEEALLFGPVPEEGPVVGHGYFGIVGHREPAALVPPLVWGVPKGTLGVVIDEVPIRVLIIPPSLAEVGPTSPESVRDVGGEYRGAVPRVYFAGEVGLVMIGPIPPPLPFDEGSRLLLRHHRPPSHAAHTVVQAGVDGKGGEAVVGGRPVPSVGGRELPDEVPEGLTQLPDKGESFREGRRWAKALNAAS